MENPLEAYLRALRVDARELSSTLSKINLTAPHAAWQWPRILAQFHLISSQMSSISQELLRPDVERDLASSFVFVPTTDSCDPGQLIRAQPIPEIVEQNQALLQEATSENTLPDLTRRLEEFNRACERLSTQVKLYPYQPGVEDTTTGRQRPDVGRVRQVVQLYLTGSNTTTAMI